MNDLNELSRAAHATPISPDAAALLRNYAISAALFSGSPDALYERHLKYDNIVEPDTANTRERYKAAARAVRDILSDRWLRTNKTYARENPKLMLYKVKTSAYKFSWALIPMSLPFLWLLFPFSRRFGLYDHAVFSTYSLTFMSLLTVVLALLGAFGVNSAPLIVAGTLIPPVHIYKQLKGAYRLGRFSALVRTTLLLSFIVGIIVPLAALVLLYLGVGD